MKIVQIVSYKYVIRTSLKQFLEAVGKIIEETWTAAAAEGQTHLEVVLSQPAEAQ